nr:glycoside hydrolase family 38 C-terminal domain-containing protein [Candidatus Sigynarchaeota archaeon]
MPDSAEKKKQLFLISHTHWDREWYLPFNSFRLRLVNVIDKALELAKNDRWNSFMLDGQTAPVEDYLEVKPENAAALKKAVEGGKILLGPWYVLADEFLESAEGLVRNLLVGHKIAEKFGKVMKCGYVPDTFGHVWQLPQILSGFGIKSSFVFRGYPPLFGGYEECRGVNDQAKLEFFWRAPDGTKVLTLHHIAGYSNASNLSESPTEGEYKCLGAVMKILGVVDRIEPRSARKLFLIMNGSDHLFPDSNVPDVVDFINNDEEISSQFHIKHTTIEDYFTTLAEDSYDLPELAGEMRGSAYTQVTPGCLSSRMYLKQASWQLSTELEHYAESMNVLAWYLGAKYPHDQLNLAWKYLLKNHPHDSICGCSTDRVHADMETRFAELGDMIETLENGAASFVWRAMKEATAGKVALPVLNVTGWEQTGPVKSLVSFSPSWMGKSLRLTDGEEHVVQECSIRVIEDYRKLDNAAKLYPMFGNMFQIFEIEFLAREVPAFGFKTWYMELDPSGKASTPAQKPGEAVLENEFVKVAVNKDGTIAILDKQSKKEWKDLLVLVDAGDDGDEYDYAPTRDGVTVLSRGGKASISAVERTAVRQSCKVDLSLRVPARITAERKRSPELVDLKASISIAVYPGEPLVRATVDTDNSVEDHRLQACFPTGLKVSKSHAADHFMVMERDIALPKDDGWFQPAQGLYHTDGFVDLSDGKTGLAVLVKGLPEFEILPSMDNAIAITLFRSVGYLSRDGMPLARGHLGRPTGLNGPFLPTPGAQCKRKMRFELAIAPHAGTWNDAKLWKLMKAFQVPLRLMVHGARNHFYEPPLATDSIKPLPFSEECMLEIEPADLVVSALKKAETSSGIVLRLFNPTSSVVQGKVKLSFEPSSVSIVNLNEEFIEAVMYSDGGFEFSIKPSQIMTFLVNPKLYNA